MPDPFVRFDIAVVDLEHAIRFYGAVPRVDVKRDFPDMPIGVFAHEDACLGALRSVFSRIDRNPFALVQDVCLEHLRVVV